MGQKKKERERERGGGGGGGDRERGERERARQTDRGREVLKRKIGNDCISGKGFSFFFYKTKTKYVVG